MAFYDPRTQIQEVFLQLINKRSIDQKTMVITCDVLNLPDCIMKLRKIKGLKIETVNYTYINKYKREISTCKYKLSIPKSEAKIIYKNIIDRYAQTSLFN